MDPITLGAIMGGCGALAVSHSNDNPNRKRSFLIGSVGGGWGGWMAVQIFSRPTVVNVLVCSVVGVIVFEKFLMI